MLGKGINLSVKLRSAGHSTKMRLGIIVVHNDPTPELELWQQAVTHASVHTVRFQLPRLAGEVYTGSDVASLLEHYGLEKALLTLRDIGVDAICLCFTSASVFSGYDFDKEFIGHAQRLTGCMHVITSARALVDELLRLEHQHIAMIIPPWYSPETVDAFKGYFQQYGIAISHAAPYELVGKWQYMPRQDRFDAGAVWHISPESVAECAVEYLESEIASFSAVVVPGSGFPSLDAGKIISQKLAKPFLSVNSASWAWFAALCEQRLGE